MEMPAPRILTFSLSREGFSKDPRYTGPGRRDAQSGRVEERKSGNLGREVWGMAFSGGAGPLGARCNISGPKGKVYLCNTELEAGSPTTSLCGIMN